MAFYDGILNWFKGAEAEFAKLLGIVEAEVPAVQTLLAGVAAVLTSYFPASGIGLYLSVVENAVTMIEGWIKTIDGVLMSPAEAKNIGVAVSPTPLSGDDKNASVLSQLKASYPELPDHIHQLAIEAHVSKARGPKA